MAGIILEGTVNAVTTTQASRLACGASITEFPDQAFQDIEAQLDLELDLNEWLGDAGLSYVTIIGLGSAGAPLPAERTDFLNLKKYCKYFLSGLIVSTVDLGFVEQMSDGQNMFKRSKLDAEALSDKMKAFAEEAKEAILSAHGGTVTEAPELLSGAGNVYDPVTDETG